MFTQLKYGLLAGLCIATAVASAADFELKVLHINDHHSHVEPEGISLLLNGQATEVDMGGFPRVSAKIKALSKNAGNVIKLHAGDAITGTLYFTLFEGEADAALMNEICFDAFALGNHEFDRGDSGLKKFLDFLDEGDCNTPVLAANVVPQVGTPLAPLTPNDYIHPYAVYDYPLLSNAQLNRLYKRLEREKKQYENALKHFYNFKTHVFPKLVRKNRYTAYLNYFRYLYKARLALADYYRFYLNVKYQVSLKEQVAVIGLDIANKTQNSSNPDSTTQFLDEQSTAQLYINQLRNRGIEKIILLTHFQYQNDLKLAQSLTSVDVVVGGDSHTLLGNFSQYGIASTGPYPTVVNNLDGKPVCVVQAWQYASVVGELNVSFNKDGSVKNCHGTPHLLLADNFERNDVAVTGEELTAIQSFIAASQELSVVIPDADSQAIVDRYSDEVSVLSLEVIGTSTDKLCLDRIPGSAGRSQICDNTTETNRNGSDISNLVALAFKEQSIEADIAIQNAGGVRTDIDAGEITIADAYTLLPFANTLTNLTMSGQEIVDVLNEAVDFSVAPDGSSGAYPYASGLRFDVDLSQPAGSRVSNIEIKLKTDSVWSAIDLTHVYTVVTNSFTAGGRDGYITFGEVSADGRSEDTFLDYAQSFVDYVKRVQTVSKLPVEEYSTQSFINEAGILQQ